MNATQTQSNYHPAPEQMAAWSAGSLALSDALCITAHMESCRTCRKSAERLNLIGGDLLESQSPAPASPVLRDQLLARIQRSEVAANDAEATTEPAADTTAGKALPKWLPNCLSQFDIDSLEKLDWKQQTAAISTYELARDGGKRLELLRIKPGGKLSKHTHIGEETTLVLTGSFSDENGVYRAGDYMQLDDSHSHATQATSDCECICLVVQDGPIQFTGFRKVLNPYLRWRFASA